MTEEPPEEPPENAGAGHLEDAPDSRAPWLSRGVGSVGLTSFFSDSGHEIATAALPSFVTSVLHGLLGGVQAAGDFVSTAVVGALYAAVSPSAGFSYAAAWMVLSAVTAGTSSLVSSSPPQTT